MGRCGERKQATRRMRLGRTRLADGACRVLAAAVTLASAGCLPAGAATLLVGPDQPLKTPSAAAKVAQDGDLVRIEPMPDGYFDCAVWEANHLTIEGVGDGVVITDKTCKGKALFVTVGNDITVRNLTLARARVPDHNGAGIRAEGVGLRVERTRFVNDEMGILAGEVPKSTITVIDSEFVDDGKCVLRCGHAISVDAATLLHVERTQFRGTKGGDFILSNALRTELIGDRIEDGADGVSRYLVQLPSGGSLVLKDSVLRKGRAAWEPIAVSIVATGDAHPVDELTITGNHVANDTGATLLFVQNWSDRTARLDGNVLGKDTIPVSSEGYVWFRMKSLARDVTGKARWFIGKVRAHL